jgi:hypothetical protein
MLRHFTVSALLCAVCCWTSAFGFMPVLQSPFHRVSTTNSISTCKMQMGYNSRARIPPPPPPRRSNAPPPPPPKPTENKVERQAGEWRESVLSARTPRPWDGQDKVVRAKKTPDMLRQERLRKEKAESKKNAAPPPPMLTEKEWEVCTVNGGVQKMATRTCRKDFFAGHIGIKVHAPCKISIIILSVCAAGAMKLHVLPMAALMHPFEHMQVALRISGAKDVQELAMQLEWAKSGDFVSLERKWLKDGASRAEVKKRLGQAMQVSIINDLIADFASEKITALVQFLFFSCVFRAMCGQSLRLWGSGLLLSRVFFDVDGTKFYSFWETKNASSRFRQSSSA